MFFYYKYHLSDHSNYSYTDHIPINYNYNLIIDTINRNYFDSFNYHINNYHSGSNSNHNYNHHYHNFTIIHCCHNINCYHNIGYYHNIANHNFHFKFIILNYNILLFHFYIIPLELLIHFIIILSFLFIQLPVAQYYSFQFILSYFHPSYSYRRIFDSIIYKNLLELLLKISMLNH